MLREVMRMLSLDGEALSTDEKEAIRKFDLTWEPFFTILKHPLM